MIASCACTLGTCQPLSEQLNQMRSIRSQKGLQLHHAWWQLRGFWARPGSHLLASTCMEADPCSSTPGVLMPESLATDLPFINLTAAGHAQQPPSASPDGQCGQWQAKAACRRSWHSTQNAAGAPLPRQHQQDLSDPQPWLSAAVCTASRRGLTFSAAGVDVRSHSPASTRIIRPTPNAPASVPLHPGAPNLWPHATHHHRHAASPRHHAASPMWDSTWGAQRRTSANAAYTFRLTGVGYPCDCHMAAGGLQRSQRRTMAVVKDRRPATLDDVVRRHRNQGPVRGFQVIEIYPNGAQLDQSTTLMSAADLGIPFRDATLFSSESTITDQKPTILVRNGCILFKSEAVRAVINENKAFVIKVKSNRSYVNLLEPLMETVKQDDAIPFELNVLEGLLYISCRYFSTRMKYMKSIMESLIRDVSDGTEPFAAVYNEVLIQQLAPLDKTITGLRNGARDTCEAVRTLLEDEELLGEICLTYQKEEKRRAACERMVDGEHEITPGTLEDMCAVGLPARNRGDASNPYYDEDYLSDKEQARRMLESYERELDSMAGTLEEMRENLDTVRDSWSMKLDSARNHIILLNLKMTLISLCLMLATLFPSWGGMNINHGLPDEPWVFWTVVVVGTSAGAISYPVASNLYRANWKKRSHRDLIKFHSLRSFLVQHLEDLDDVMEAVRRISGRMNRMEFEAHMKDAMPSALWKRASLDFLFSAYDLNKDGFLEGMEVAKKAAEDRELEEAQMGHLRMGHIDDLYEEHHAHDRSWMDFFGMKDDQQDDDAHPDRIGPMGGGLPHEQRGWIQQLWFGQAPPQGKIEERSGGRIVRH